MLSLALAFCASYSVLGQFGPDASAALGQMEEVEIAYFRCAGVNNLERNVIVESTILIDSLILWNLSSDGGIVRGSATFMDLPLFTPDPFLVFTESRDSLVLDFLSSRYTIRYDDLEPIHALVQADEFHVIYIAVEGRLRAEAWDYIPGKYGPDKEALFEAILKVVDHILIKCNRGGKPDDKEKPE